MKKSKKFVLVGLVLLAITGLLVIAGCKTEVDQNPIEYSVTFNANDFRDVNYTAVGVVPALSISLQSNLSLEGKIFLTEN